jgi:glycosyltransferase involved in cell wall biosynthesis
MDDRIPFIVYGDGPRLPTGLARIARDLISRLYMQQEDMGIRLAQVGVDWPGGWHFQAWDFMGFQPTAKDQGREAVACAVEQLREETGQRPIMLMIMDPARCYDLTRVGTAADERETIDAEFWGYFPLDAQNRLDAIGGPAARAVRDTQRVLGYGRWGAGLLKRTLEAPQPRYQTITPPPPAVSYLPHGIETRVFRPGVPLEAADTQFHIWAAQQGDALRIGCVATNQARKDLGLLFSTVAELKAQGLKVAVWLHTDKLTHIWDVGELVRTCGLDASQVAVSVEELTDPQLAARYGWTDVTLAVGLGEGFGYPIVESLACGTPCIHGDYAGGVELIPDPAWRVPAVAWRLESVYALLRPVYHPKDWAAAIVRVRERTRAHPQLVEAYCRGAVAYLDWAYLWPRWQGWINAGLKERRDGQGRATKSVQDVDTGGGRVEGEGV